MTAEKKSAVFFIFIQNNIDKKYFLVHIVISKSDYSINNFKPISYEREQQSSS